MYYTAWRASASLGLFTRIAKATLQRQRAEHDGACPETTAQVMWGLDTIKTRCESIAIALEPNGARPSCGGSGKIARYALIPLAEMGRPRVDVLMHLSPIFRDTLVLIVDHLDRLVKDVRTISASPYLSMAK